MTPAQLEAQLEGWQWRRDRELELWAYFTACQIQAQGGKVQADDLLPPDVLFRKMNQIR